MINAEKSQNGSATKIKLSGSIEESVNFEQILGPPTGEMQIFCKEIARLNSVGVKSWIKYFQLCQSKGTKLSFSECSTAIVEQINLISNFSCGGSIESIFVPFSCTKCKAELLGLYNCSDLKKLNMNIPDLKCTKCGSPAVFDDIPEEYFGFLNRI